MNQFPIEIYNYSINYETEETYRDYFHPKFPKWLSWLIFIVGVLSNIVSTIIFRHLSVKRNSIFTYLAYLSVIDTFVLVLGLGDIMLISYLNFVIRDLSIFTCRIHVFFLYFFTHLSSFTLVAIWIDRAICLNYIAYAKKYCVPSKAHKVMARNCLIAVLINFHSLLFLGSDAKLNSTVSPYLNSSIIVDNSTVKYQVINKITDIDNMRKFQCRSEKDSLYEKFIEPYFEWIDWLTYSLIPFIIMIICTFFILKAVFKSNSSTSKSNAMKFRHSVVKLTKQDQDNISRMSLNDDELKVNTVSCNSRSVLKKARAFNATKHLTYTLLTTNLFFFCLLNPLLVILMLKSSGDIKKTNKILLNSVYLLAYTNHSLNFIFYGISSPQYREYLIECFVKCRNPSLQKQRTLNITGNERKLSSNINNNPTTTANINNNNNNNKTIIINDDDNLVEMDNFKITQLSKIDFIDE
jgi:hypothetical protein